MCHLIPSPEKGHFITEQKEHNKPTRKHSLVKTQQAREGTKRNMIWKPRSSFGNHIDFPLLSTKCIHVRSCSKYKFFHEYMPLRGLGENKARMQTNSFKNDEILSIRSYNLNKFLKIAWIITNLFRSCYTVFKKSNARHFFLHNRQREEVLRKKLSGIQGCHLSTAEDLHTVCLQGCVN